MKIIKASDSDLYEILELQYLAYQSEAKLLNNFSIPPLKQTYDDLVREYNKGVFLKAANENGAIIGSVRAYMENDTVYISKLIVHPEKQGQGIGTTLLLTIENELPALKYELYTSDKSIRNIRLYERLGYVRYRDEKINDNLTLVYLMKCTNVY